MQKSCHLTLNILIFSHAGYAIFECSVVQWLEITDNPKFHRKLIETDSEILIEDILVAPTALVDKMYQVNENEMESNEQNPNSPVEM